MPRSHSNSPQPQTRSRSNSPHQVHLYNTGAGEVTYYHVKPRLNAPRSPNNIVENFFQAQAVRTGPNDLIVIAISVSKNTYDGMYEKPTAEYGYRTTEGGIDGADQDKVKPLVIGEERYPSEEEALRALIDKIQNNRAE